MSQHDLLVIDQDERLANKTIDSLQKKGFSVNTTSNLENIHETLNSLNRPIVILNCSLRSPIKEFIDSVCDLNFNIHYPVIAIATDVSGLEVQLNQFFPLGVVLQTPCDPTRLIETIRFIERNYRDSLPTASTTSQNPGVTSTEETEETAPAPSSSELLSAVRTLKLDALNLGGAELPLMLSGRQDFHDDVSLPHDSNLSAGIKKFLEGLKPSVRITLERINLISLKILAPLGLEHADEELAKAASFMYAYSIASKNRSLLRRDYSFRGGIVFRKEICSAVKDAALDVGSEFSNRELSQIIAKVARIIGQEEIAEEDSTSLIASAIVLADLMNRLCFQVPLWNPAAAYSLLRKIRQGRVKGLHPAALCTSIKLLAEAISCPLNQKLLGPKRNGQQPMQEPILANTETMVEIPALAAGMQLSQPLCTEDGKALLKEDLILDDDLILRIWQLSAVRTLNKAIIRRVH